MRRVAVIGSGVSGLVAAHVLARTDRVTLFEADDRLGGHADTHEVRLGDRTLAVDTGFIVHNERTYPTLLALFAELGIETQQTDMSMSIRDDADNIEYAGGSGLSGLLPSARLVGRPRYLRMLGEVTRFHRAARELLDRPDGDDRVETDGAETLEQFLQRHRFGRDFRRWFMTPLVAAVWSCDPADAGDYPARHLFTFLDHHGMLGVLGSPSWRTVRGGSRTYVAKVAAGLHEVRTGCPVTAVRERGDFVLVEAGGAVEEFDAVVVAVHAPTALSMLPEATAEQREVLGAIRYSRNVARLHTDESLLPRNLRARASWNYLVPTGGDRAEVVVTYDMTRLQRLTAAGDTRLLVTLGAADLIDPSAVLATMEYEHPLFTPAAVAAAARVPEIESDRVVFAGAWQGWGFHEDGAASGLRAAQRLGARSPWSVDGPQPAPPVDDVLPRIYRTTVRHARREPVDHRFSYRSTTWLVDLDHLPDHGALARFESRDHVGSPDRSIRQNIDSFLAAHGIDLSGGRVLMLAMPRVAGYCFNPISVHWCFAGDEQLAGVVVEVHNTYGDRHAYLVHPDAQGNASVDKELYVSPFNDTSGRYRLRVPVPGEELDIAVTLLREGQAPFVATMRGTGVPATAAEVRRTAWQQPVAPAVVAARIRRHGISLWGKGLQVQQRPVHEEQPGLTAGIDTQRWPDLEVPAASLRTRVSASVARRLFAYASRSSGVEIGPSGPAESSAIQLVRPDDFHARVGRDGLIGFGEAYMAGDWTADDPAAVLTEYAARVDRLVPKPLQLLRRAYVARHPHSDRRTQDNSRSNIARHYDLSNDLFAQFLDPTMTYSSAWFAQHADLAQNPPGPDDLEKAQVAKIERLLDRVGVGQGTRLLEIGSGWGELAIRAARRGAVVTTVTLSQEQQQLVRERVAEADLDDRVEVRLEDFRAVRGTFDAVVSVEMIEAVGLDHLPEYFDTIGRVLAPGGRAGLQAITMPHDRLLATRDTFTWVHKYIFPGGQIPSIEAIDSAGRGAGLTIEEDFRFGAHYDHTLRLWQEQFAAHTEQVRDLGFDEVFIRMWEFYLAYSRAGFASGYLDVRQVVLVKGR